MEMECCELQTRKQLTPRYKRGAVRVAIRKTNNATTTATETLKQSGQAVTVTSGAGNVKQEVERKKEDN